jgi:hypothetical protein
MWRLWIAFFDRLRAELFAESEAQVATAVA